MTASCVYLSLYEVFQITSFIEQPCDTTYFIHNFQVQVHVQPPDTVKKYFTVTLKAFYTKTRSSYSKALFT